jgi:hypothetical protein
MRRSNEFVEFVQATAVVGLPCTVPIQLYAKLSYSSRQHVPVILVKITGTWLYIVDDGAAEGGAVRHVVAVCEM